MDVEVDDSTQPLFERLLAVAGCADACGVQLRLIGGAALQLWGRHFGVPRQMTEDLDWALTRLELDTPDAAAALIEDLRAALGELGFVRPLTWRDRPNERYKLVHEPSRIAVEFLCGNLDFGRPSRRPPSYRVADPDIYAARTPWIDKVDEWISVNVIGVDRQEVVEIPSVNGLALLKVKAVSDKMARLAQELTPAQRDHERQRLSRHADDLCTTVKWSEQRGEYVDFLGPIRSDQDVRSTVLTGERTLAQVGSASPATENELRRLWTRLVRVANSE